MVELFLDMCTCDDTIHVCSTPMRLIASWEGVTLWGSGGERGVFGAALLSSQNHDGAP